jgi:adenosine deaminase
MSNRIPKAELHLHIEGTLEPELAFALAARNGVELPYATAEELRKAYSFSDLQSFLDLYYALMAVLRTEEDFALLADAYLARAAKQGVRHAEIFFDPQAHTARGVPIGTVIEGLGRALDRSEDLHGISTRLIMCFLRDESADSAMETFEAARPWFGRIAAVGLDSAESRTRGRRARPRTSLRRWTSSASSASTTASAAWRTRPWSNGWSATRSR